MIVVLHKDHRRTLADISGNPVEAPSELTKLDGHIWVTSGESGTLAYVPGTGSDPNATERKDEIWFTPNMWTTPATLLGKIPPNVLQDAVELSGDKLLLFVNGHGTFLADVHTNKVASLSPVLGGFAPRRGSLYLINEPRATKGEPPTNATLYDVPAEPWKGPCTVDFSG